MSYVTPLSQPLPGASFGQAVSRFFSKYATFKGRASRSEFWWVVLFLGLISLVYAGAITIALAASGQLTEVTDGATVISTSGPFMTILFVIGSLWSLAIIIPWLALASRRLHDVNMSAWWLLLYLTGIGGIFVYIVALIPSNPAGARFDGPTY